MKALPYLISIAMGVLLASIAKMILTCPGCPPSPDCTCPSAAWFTDARDGHVYHTSRYVGLNWMVDNLAYETEHSR